MTKSELVSMLSNSERWTRDRFGHFKNSTGNIRLKIQPRALRCERKLSDGRWINCASDYYGNIQYSPVESRLLVSNSSVKV
jgi:hypothetical protein